MGEDSAVAIGQPIAKVEYKGKELLYAIQNDHCLWRCKTIFTKEPDTIEWIESMAPGETLIDVGANIGIYTIFAAHLGLKVFAFEPEASNYALLCRSITINDFDVPAYPIALSDCFKADWLYLSGYLPGGSVHTFGANLGHRLTEREHILKQGCISMPLDVFEIRADHIKIDVDGLEHVVIAGAMRTLRDVKSVLVEINEKLPAHLNLCAMLENLGFRSDPEQVAKARRSEGTFEGCGNRIFRR